MGAIMRIRARHIALVLMVLVIGSTITTTGWGQQHTNDHQTVTITDQSLAPAATAPPINTTATSWQTLESEHFRIKYKDGDKSDAEQVLEWMQFARKHVHEYWNESVSIKVDVYLHPENDWNRNQYTMYTNSGYSPKEGYDSNIHLKAISDMTIPADSSEERHHRKLKKILTHEYTQVPLYKVRHKEQYGSSISTPNWFTQGVSEYVATQQTTEKIRQFKLTETKSVRTMITDGRGYLSSVAETPYNGGMLIVRYMVDQYGWDTVVKLFTTTEYDHFYPGLRKETGDDIRDFQNGWLDWAETNIGGNYTVDDTNTDLKSKIDSLQATLAEKNETISELRNQSTGPSISVTVTPSGNTSQFTVGNRAVVTVDVSTDDPTTVDILFDETTYRPNTSGIAMIPLEQAGVQQLTVQYENTSESVQLRTVSSAGEANTTQSIANAIAGSDGRIGITDIQQAIQYWASDSAVPNTDGQTIGITKLQQLIQRWASN